MPKDIPEAGHMERSLDPTQNGATKQSVPSLVTVVSKNDLPWVDTTQATRSTEELARPQTLRSTNTRLELTPDYPFLHLLEPSGEGTRHSRVGKRYGQTLGLGP